MKEVKAMMAGIVVEVSVRVGDQVQEGAVVVVLESMKMQLPVPAEASGVVQEIKVKVGDFINEGEILLTLA